MKKLIKLMIVSSCMALAFSGCTISDALSDHLSTFNQSTEEDPVSAVPKQRVYMDEIKGTLLDFTGNTLTLSHEKQKYVFDLSNAALECEDGMITGDEISVIYEGQLSDDDTSTVKALKVVDDFHKTNQLETRKAYGELQSLTSNTITIKNKKGKTATYPITGSEQYYQNGIHTGSWVYIYFKGKFAAADDEQTSVLNAAHLKVLSISDIDPLERPKPTTAQDPETQPEASEEKQLHAVIRELSTSHLTVVPSDSDAVLTIDLANLPVYLKGGAAPGSNITLTYTGEFTGNSLDGIIIHSVSGEDPDSLDRRNMNSTISGTILGGTSNTITIRTNDGAMVTCFTDSLTEQSVYNSEAGNGIRITFDPSVSRESNIYTALKIEEL